MKLICKKRIFIIGIFAAIILSLSSCDFDDINYNTDEIDKLVLQSISSYVIYDNSFCHNSFCKDFTATACKYDEDWSITDYFEVTDAMPITTSSNSYTKTLVQYKIFPIDYLLYMCKNEQMLRYRYNAQRNQISELPTFDEFNDFLTSKKGYCLHVLTEITEDEDWNVINLKVVCQSTDINRILDYKDDNYFMIY